jgi:hypothetical protein
VVGMFLSLDAFPRTFLGSLLDATFLSFSYMCGTHELVIYAISFNKNVKGEQ